MRSSCCSGCSACYQKDKNKDNDDKFTPTIDSDSGEIGTGSNYSGGQQGIRIPGYPSITIDAGKIMLQ